MERILIKNGLTDETGSISCFVVKRLGDTWPSNSALMTTSCVLRQRFQQQLKNVLTFVVKACPTSVQVNTTAVEV